MRKTIAVLLTLVSIGAFPEFLSAQNHKNFRVAVYIPVNVVEKMKDRQWLQATWETINSQVKVDEVYIETYRSRRIADEQLIEQVKKFFLDRGVQIAGGMALTGNDSGQFESFCYTDPTDREYLKNISAMTARHFDEIILDDFFFVTTKNDSDIAAKGSKSWTDFRLALMDDAAKNLVIGPAKAANAKVKVVIKFPNWYEHFQGLGFDLEREPKLFDGIYTGTETRDPVNTDQHLQQYESYEVFRYFENIKPGGNGGGWVDTFSINYIDRYAEQLWDTMFAKAPEITLFNWDLLLREASAGDRDKWKDTQTSFNFEKMSAGQPKPNMATVAAYSLNQVDALTGQLGNPIGIKSYKPYQSTGEDFLHDYLGMIGIPVEMSPTFPADANPVLLTESAKYDPGIVGKIERQLHDGKNVVITSGLLHALQGKGIEDIVELRYTGRKLSVHDYMGAFGPGGGTELGTNSNSDVLFPEIRFLTNDAWPLVRGVANGNGAPILLMDHYSKGTIFVWTIPDNFNDLYSMPEGALTAIKSYILGDFPVRLDAPSQVSLFAYDNNSFVVESFLDHEAKVAVSTTGGFSKIRNLASGEVLNGNPAVAQRSRRPQGPPRINFSITIPPHSYLGFAQEK